MTRIQYVTGDATDPQGPGVKIIAHCVSNNGRSYGKGFALTLAKKWPDARTHYKLTHEAMAFNGKMPLGAVVWWEQEYRHKDIELSRYAGGPSPVLIEAVNTTHRNRIGIMALVAQEGLGRTSLRLDALKTALEYVAPLAIELNASIHMPRIGCGLAGGNWAEVEPVILSVFNLPLASFVPVTVYDPPKDKL